MPSFLCKIVKAYSGHEWEQVYCVQTDGDPEPGFGADDWLAATGGVSAFTDINTDPSNVSYAGDISIIHALIGFERLIHFSNVQFVRMFAWDGIENETETSTFVTSPLSFLGQRAIPAGDSTNVAPGNNTWLVAKQPTSFGARAGRSYYRMCLADNQIRVNGDGLIDWQDATAQAFMDTTLSGSVTTSGLDAYFGTGVGEGIVKLAIPRYIASGEFEGSLQSSTTVQSLVSRYPDSRQVKRGRRR